MEYCIRQVRESESWDAVMVQVFLTQFVLLKFAVGTKLAGKGMSKDK